MSGDPLGTEMRARRPRAADPLSVFWSRVDKSGECWLWLGAVNSAGYGTYTINGTSKIAHRLAYEIAVGPIPPGLELDHLCRERLCVRPNHLDPVTSSENHYRALGPPLI